MELFKCKRDVKPLRRRITIKPGRLSYCTSTHEQFPNFSMSCSDYFRPGNIGARYHPERVKFSLLFVGWYTISKFETNVNGLPVVILVTAAHFLGVLTEKNEKQRKSREISKKLFRDFLFYKRYIFIGNC